MKLKKGDKVLVIAGKERNKTGVIEKVFPAKNKVIVTGLNVAKKHLKRSAKNPQGGIIDINLPLNASNVMLLDPNSGKPTRISYRHAGDQKHRIARVSNQMIKETK